MTVQYAASDAQTVNINLSSGICLLATALAALFVASSCGGGSGGSQIEVAMTEFSYTESASTASAGEEITLVLDNTGTVIHNWSPVRSTV